MNPIDFPESNIVFWAGDNVNVRDVLGFHGKEDGPDGRDACVLCYEPSPEERASIAAGAPVWLVMLGETMRPVRLQVESPFAGEMPAPQPARKKYIVFAFGDYYPSGGLNDIVYESDDLADVDSWLASNPRQGETVDVIDRDTWQSVELPSEAAVPPHMPMVCRRCGSEFMGCDCPDAEHAAQYPDVREVIACRDCAGMIDKTANPAS